MGGACTGGVAQLRALRASIQRRFIELGREIDAKKNQRDQARTHPATTPRFDTDLIDELPNLALRLREAPEALQRALYDAYNLKVSYHKPTGRVTIVPNPKQVAELLTAVSYVGTYKRAGGRRYVAFFGCLYYGLQRPEEVIALNIDDCYLPEEKKWGRLTLHKATPYAGRRWTEDGELHDDKSLKQRADGETRNVPIPPQLVRLLRKHIAEFGVGDGGLIFRTERGKPVTPFAYERVWKEARLLGLPPERAKSSLADIPYDLRAAGISLALRTTRDPARIAERAGNSIKILMERYAWALDEEDDAANKAIGEALGDDDGDDSEDDRDD